MQAFRYYRRILHVEQIPLSRLARRFGTPLYVYSLQHVRERYREMDRAFAGMDHLICYSVKANSNLALLAALFRQGAGFDIVSGGELYRLKQIGADMDKVLFAGVGKSLFEIEEALRAGIRLFNLESWPEAERLDSAAARLGMRARAAFRFNPDVRGGAHRYISTGSKESKFGLPLDQAAILFRQVRRLRHLRLSGLHLHIGSQITEIAPFLRAARKAAALVGKLRRLGFEIESLNMGGGLGILYHRERPLSPSEFAHALRPILAPLGVQLLLEPGRCLVGNAGMLLTRVEYLKRNGRKDFVIVDAAMNDLIRPSFYGAYHAVQPVELRPSRLLRRVDVVGPVCESGDFFAKDRSLPLPRQGELLALHSAGAYGFTMSSNYNSRPRAAEVVVDGARVLLARRRETYADLVRGEKTFP